MLKANLNIFALCFGVALSAGAADIDVSPELLDQPFDLRASRIEYTNNTMMASGGVTGRFENAMIRADRISGNHETGDLHIEGNILFERENVVWQGTELDYNYLTQSGNFGPSSFAYDPVLMSVDHVERASTNVYRLQGADFTTCTNDHPHYHVTAKEARLIDEEMLVAKGMVARVGKVPVFYFPYWRQKLSRKIFTYEFGAGSEWGVYGLINANVPINKHLESNTDLNLYSKRGVGIGQGFEWDFPNAVGEISGFYLKDEDPYYRYGQYDTNSVGPLIGDDRYRFKLEHLQRFTDEHYVNTKLNYLSDPAVLEEFFKSEYRKNPQPENYLSWVYGNNVVGTEAFVNQRLNDFYANTDRLEYSMDLYRTKLANTPLYIQSENTVAYLNRVHAETNFPVMTSYDSRRVDTDNTVFLPQRWGFLSVVPRASYRATYYSDTTAFNNGAEDVRLIPGAGMEVSFQATKILSERERWYGRGLRHKIEPYADYRYENTSISPYKLHQFDDVDGLMDENRVQIGLRNVLQTRRSNRVSRFIDLDLYTFYQVEDYGTMDDNFDSLFLDARMPLTQRNVIDIEGEVDWNRGRVPFFNTRYSYIRDDVILGVEHLYREGQQSLLTPRFDLYPEGKWSLEGYARYEERSNDLEEIAMVGYVNWCCMRYGLGYHFYDDNEHRVMFSIGLSAFPDAKLSSGF